MRSSTSAATSPLLSERLKDPYFLLLDFDAKDEEAVFVQTRPDWLDEKLRLSAFDFPLSSLMALPIHVVAREVSHAVVMAGIHFLFHLPFSGSSFLTRHLEGGAVHLLRDPACLDAVFQGDDPVGELPIDGLRALALTMMSRTAGNRPTLVRTAGYHPAMMVRLAGSFACRSAMFLHCDPEVFILQVLKSERRRADLRILHRSHRRVTEADSDAALGDVEIAIHFWVDMVRAALAARGPTLKTIDCEVLFARPDEVLQAVGAHLEIRPQTWRERSVAVRQSHAKTGVTFDATARDAELARLRSVYARDLKFGQPLLSRLGTDRLFEQLQARSLL